jgi:hypothetical protein
VTLSVLIKELILPDFLALFALVKERFLWGFAKHSKKGAPEQNQLWLNLIPFIFPNPTR